MNFLRYLFCPWAVIAELRQQNDQLQEQLRETQESNEAALIQKDQDMEAAIELSTGPGQLLHFALLCVLVQSGGRIFISDEVCQFVKSNNELYYDVTRLPGGYEITARLADNNNLEEEQS